MQTTERPTVEGPGGEPGEGSRPRPLVRRILSKLAVTAAAGVILGVGVGGVLFLLNRGAVEAETVDTAVTLPVRTVVVPRDQTYEVARRFTGRVVARRISELGFERSGLVTEVLVDDGATVAAGDVIARLDTRILDAERLRLVADREQVIAQLDLARRTAERRQTLNLAGHTSEQAYDDARFEVQSLEAQLRSVEAAVAAIDVDLDKTILVAPFDGRISGRAVDEGAVVQAGQSVVRIVETGATEVRVGVPSRFAERLQPASGHAVYIGGTQLDAVVTAILPDLETETRTVTAVFRIDADIASPSGELAVLELGETVETAGGWIPLDALTEGRRGLWTVYALEPARPADYGFSDPGHPIYQVRRNDVEIIHPDTDRVYVRGTLPAQALVVSEGIHRLVPGQLVHRAEDAPAARLLAQRLAAAE